MDTRRGYKLKNIANLARNDPNRWREVVLLAQLGNPRPGVGLRDDGLPNIERREVRAGSFGMGDDGSHKVTFSTSGTTTGASGWFGRAAASIPNSEILFFCFLKGSPDQMILNTLEHYTEFGNGTKFEKKDVNNDKDFI